jgi:hypothetical protein
VIRYPHVLTVYFRVYYRSIFITGRKDQGGLQQKKGGRVFQQFQQFQHGTDCRDSGTEILVIDRSVIDHTAWRWYKGNA